MHRKIIALAVSATSVAALAFGTVGSATAAEAPPGSITTAVCNALPSQVSALLAQLGLASSAVPTAATEFETKRAAADAAMSALVDAVVTHIETVNDGGNVDATGSILIAKYSIASDKIVAANNAMTKWFEAQRNVYLTGLTSGYLSGVQSGLCGIA